MSSLRARVTWAAALVMLVFMALTSLALEQAFQASAVAAREERLLGQIYLLMAAADVDDDGLTLPRDLAEAR
nr:two-component sensor histidine kinase [Chromatiaceae bacterium]